MEYGLSRDPTRSRLHFCDSGFGLQVPILKLPITLLIFYCKELLNQQWRVVPHHVYCKANSCADILANKGRTQMDRLDMIVTLILCINILFWIQEEWKLVEISLYHPLVFIL